MARAGIVFKSVWEYMRPSEGHSLSDLSSRQQGASERHRACPFFNFIPLVTGQTLSEVKLTWNIARMTVVNTITLVRVDKTW